MLSNTLGRSFYIALAVAAGALLATPMVRGAIAQSSVGEPTLEREHREGEHRQVVRTLANRLAPAEQATYQTLYVDSQIGNDSANGVESEPLRTVTRALEVASPNTVIVLAPGRYSQGTGEVFPLQLKPGVTIQGTPGSSERTAIIEGGGSFNSPSRSEQNAAIVAADRAGIAQIAISNPDGYGVWVESASPTILESAFVGNRQTGIYVAGGSPRVHGSYFSGNQVAGLIVFGSSSADIQRNIFDSTGDAIRVLEGATPEIVGNRITNNDAGLVLVGDADPLVQDNQIVGNRRNEVVEVAARRNVASRREDLAAEAFAAESEVVKVPDDRVVRPAVASRPEPLSVLEDSDFEIAFETEEDSTTVELVADSASEQQLSQPLESSVEQSLGHSERAIPDGAPGAALQALQSGLALGPRAVTEENPDSSSLLRNRRRRRQEEAAPNPEVRPAPPVNNNRLAVPNAAIPISSGSSSLFSPPSGAIPSRAQALGLYYRVFVEASDPFVQDEIKEVVPDAFRTRFEGRTVMQVGAFPTEEEAEERKDILEENDFDAQVEYIR